MESFDEKKLFAAPRPAASKPHLELLTQKWQLLEKLEDFVDPPLTGLLGFSEVQAFTLLGASVHFHGPIGSRRHTLFCVSGELRSCKVAGTKGKYATQALLHSFCCQG
jgi:hypothetical protein